MVCAFIKHMYMHIGIAYGFTNCLVWNCMVFVIKDVHLPSATGLIACGLNILPALLPLLMAAVSVLPHPETASNADIATGERNSLLVLVASAWCACFSAYMTSTKVN